MIFAIAKRHANWVINLLVMVCVLNVRAEKPIEGFGAVTNGGEGGETYHVTTLDNDGPGSLRDAVSKGNRYVVFDIGGEIVLNSAINIKVSNLTIDGFTAPEPGITIKKSTLYMLCLGIAGGAQDIIIRYIRVKGMFKKWDESKGNNLGTMYIAGTNIRRIVLDHITTRNAYDSGLDMWGDIRDVTIQYSLIAYSLHPQTISHYPVPFKGRRNISIHHCVYSDNEERNPQMRALTRNIDYVNNIVHNWRWYGIRIKNNWAPGEPKVTANLINNAFIPGNGRRSWALVYGESPGPDSRDLGPESLLSQGTVYTDSDMDSLYVSGNFLPLENEDHYSTIDAPLPIPDNAKVTTYEVSALADSVLPFAGTHYPLNDEASIFNAIRDSLRERIPTSIEKSPVTSLQTFYLDQNYPNPFNPTTTISFFLPYTQSVSLKVFDTLGRTVAELLNSDLESGLHKLNFDGRELPGGLYFYRIQTERNVKFRKMLLIQ